MPLTGISGESASLDRPDAVELSVGRVAAAGSSIETTGSGQISIVKKEVVMQGYEPMERVY